MAIHIGGIHGTAVTTCSAVAHGHMLTVDKLVPAMVEIYSFHSMAIETPLKQSREKLFKLLAIFL